MQITVIQSNYRFLEEYDYRCFYAIKVNGETKISFMDGEPEDANLGRDFSDIYSIPALLQEAYNAGKRGEEFIVKELDISSLDEIK